MRRDVPSIRYAGYVPGAIGMITECHAVHYHQEWGFDRSFEIQVAAELASFLDRFQKGRDGLWVGQAGPCFAGSVAVDGSLHDTEGARLRWFIVPAPYHGQGIGKHLIQKALSFCRAAGHDRVFLWTFRGLERARFLYEQEGFRLTKENEVEQWGQRIQEQRFDLVRRT